MTSTCPSCFCIQPDGILCHDCTAAVATMLAAAPQLIDQLDVAVSKQARVSRGSYAGSQVRPTSADDELGSSNLKHERSPVNWGAVAARDALLVELALWGDDLNAIRTHVQAAEIVSGIGRAVKDAYRAIDRMQDRQYLGQCLVEEDGAVCHAEVWVRPGAHQVRCTQCETVHDVPARRAALLQRAEDMLVTVKEASRYMGEVGHIVVTEASIRGYLHRGRIGYRSGTMIRLGDLLAVVVDEGERRSA